MTKVQPTQGALKPPSPAVDGATESGPPQVAHNSSFQEFTISTLTEVNSLEEIHVDGSLASNDSKVVNKGLDENDMKEPSITSTSSLTNPSNSSTGISFGFANLSICATPFAPFELSSSLNETTISGEEGVALPDSGGSTLSPPSSILSLSSLPSSLPTTQALSCADALETTLPFATNPRLCITIDGSEDTGESKDDRNNAPDSVSCSNTDAIDSMYPTSSATVILGKTTQGTCEDINTSRHKVFDTVLELSPSSLSPDRTKLHPLVSPQTQRRRRTWARTPLKIVDQDGQETLLSPHSRGVCTSLHTCISTGDDDHQVVALKMDSVDEEDSGNPLELSNKHGGPDMHDKEWMAERMAESPTLSGNPDENTANKDASSLTTNNHSETLGFVAPLRLEDKLNVDSDSDDHDGALGKAVEGNAHASSSVIQSSNDCPDEAKEKDDDELYVTTELDNNSLSCPTETCNTTRGSYPQFAPSTELSPKIASGKDDDDRTSAIVAAMTSAFFTSDTKDTIIIPADPNPSGLRNLDALADNETFHDAVDSDTHLQLNTIATTHEAVTKTGPSQIEPPSTPARRSQFPLTPNSCRKLTSAVEMASNGLLQLEAEFASTMNADKVNSEKRRARRSAFFNFNNGKDASTEPKDPVSSGQDDFDISCLDVDEDALVEASEIERSQRKKSKSSKYGAFDQCMTKHTTSHSSTTNNHAGGNPCDETAGAELSSYRSFSLSHLNTTPSKATLSKRQLTGATPLSSSSSSSGVAPFQSPPNFLAADHSVSNVSTSYLINPGFDSLSGGAENCILNSGKKESRDKSFTVYHDNDSDQHGIDNTGSSGDLPPKDQINICTAPVTLSAAPTASRASRLSFVSIPTTLISSSMDFLNSISRAFRRSTSSIGSRSSLDVSTDDDHQPSSQDSEVARPASTHTSPPTSCQTGIDNQMTSAPVFSSPTHPTDLATVLIDAFNGQADEEAVTLHEIDDKKKCGVLPSAHSPLVTTSVDTQLGRSHIATTYVDHSDVTPLASQSDSSLQESKLDSVHLAFAAANEFVATTSPTLTTTAPVSSCEVLVSTTPPTAPPPQLNAHSSTSLLKRKSLAPRPSTAGNYTSSLYRKPNSGVSTTTTPNTTTTTKLPMSGRLSSNLQGARPRTATSNPSTSNHVGLTTRPPTKSTAHPPRLSQASSTTVNKAHHTQPVPTSNPNVNSVCSKPGPGRMSIAPLRPLTGQTKMIRPLQQGPTSTLRTNAPSGPTKGASTLPNSHVNPEQGVASQGSVRASLSSSMKPASRVSLAPSHTSSAAAGGKQGASHSTTTTLPTAIHQRPSTAIGPRKSMGATSTLRPLSAKSSSTTPVLTPSTNAPLMSAPRPLGISSLSRLNSGAASIPRRKTLHPGLGPAPGSTITKSGSTTMNGNTSSSNSHPTSTSRVTSVSSNNNGNSTSQRIRAGLPSLQSNPALPSMKSRMSLPAVGPR